MPSFGKRSTLVLNQLHPSLQRLNHYCIQIIDYSLIEGFRSHSSQQAAFDLGTSLALPGQSPHNYFPALAFDFIPYPLISWEDKASFARIIGVMQAVSMKMFIPLKFGYDWGWDNPHVQLKNWKVYIEAQISK